MDVTEAEHGMMRLRRVKTSVSKLLEDVLEIYRLIAEEKRIEITTDFQGPCEANIDPNRVRQALANLVDNAVKYTLEGGRIEIIARSRESGDGSQETEVRSQESGVRSQEMGNGRRKAEDGRLKTEDGRRQAVVVTIQDNGMGIPANELPRIWDRLYRGDKSRSQRGLGLGLSLVKAVVEAHGGKVSAESAESVSAGASASDRMSQGSVFTVELPC
jgi:signal transduction histidine kinase